MMTARFSPQILLLIAGVAIGLMIARSCNGNRTGTSGEIIHSDTVTVVITDTFTLEKPKYITRPFSETMPTFETITEYQQAFDTLYMAFNDTNVYHIDSLGVSAELTITQNKLNFARFTVEREQTIITNTIKAQEQNKLLICAGVSYPFGAFVGAGFQHKKGTIIHYNYSTAGVHSVGVMQGVGVRR